MSTTTSHADLHTEIGQLIERREDLAAEIANIDESIKAIHEIVAGTRDNRPKRASASQPVGRVGPPAKARSEPSSVNDDQMTHADAALVFVEQHGPVIMHQVVTFLNDRGATSPYSIIDRLVGKGELKKYKADGTKVVAIA